MPQHAVQELKQLHGRAVPELLGVGTVPLGGAFLATRLLHGTPLSALPEVSEAVASAAEQALSLVHGGRVAQGDIRLSNLILLAEGTQQQPLQQQQGPPDAPGAAATGAAPRGQGGPAPPAAAAGQEAMAGCQVMLVDFGRAWAQASDEELERRAPGAAWPAALLVRSFIRTYCAAAAHYAAHIKNGRTSYFVCGIANASTLIRCSAHHNKLVCEMCEGLVAGALEP